MPWPGVSFGEAGVRGGRNGHGREPVRSRQSAPTEKPGDTDKNNPHIVSGSPEPPPPGGGRGRSRTQLPSEEEIPGKSREIPSRKFTIPPRLVNGIFIFHCKPARKKFPKKLDKGGLGLYLCRWKNSLQRSGRGRRLCGRLSDQKQQNHANKKVRPAKDKQTELFTIKQPLLWEKIFTYTSNNKTRTDPTNM